MKKDKINKDWEERLAILLKGTDLALWYGDEWDLSDEIIEIVEQEKQKSFVEGVKQGRQSIVAEISVSENMDKIERFFLDCPVDYDDKCNLWFDFIKDLVFDKEWD